MTSSRRRPSWLRRKEQHMTRLPRVTVFVLTLAGLAGLGIASMPAVVTADEDARGLSFDVACDCRTGSPGFFAGERGDPFIVNGKIFPAGTLPAGTATNDPTQPVNGVASIGNWICRGQVAGIFPPAIASAYGSTPPVF